MCSVMFIGLWFVNLLRLEHSVIYGDKATDVSNIFNVSEGKWKKQLNSYMVSNRISDKLLLIGSILIDISLVVIFL